jgi:hypothetical protein
MPTRLTSDDDEWHIANLEGQDKSNPKQAVAAASSQVTNFVVHELPTVITHSWLQPAATTLGTVVPGVATDVDSLCTEGRLDTTAPKVWSMPARPTGDDDGWLNVMRKLVTRIKQQLQELVEVTGEYATKVLLPCRFVKGKGKQEEDEDEDDFTAKGPRDNVNVYQLCTDKNDFIHQLSFEEATTRLTHLDTTTPRMRYAMNPLSLVHVYVYQLYPDKNNPFHQLIFEEPFPPHASGETFDSIMYLHSPDGTYHGIGTPTLHQGYVYEQYLNDLLGP